MTTLHPDPVIWFAGLGFRPAVWTPPHRADHVDPPRLVPSPDADEPLLAKYDAPAGHGFGFVLWLDTAPAAPQITAASLAGPTPGPAVWHPSTPSQPWWPSEPNQPEWPCCIIIGPEPELPPIAPVPLPASAGLLLVAVAALALWRRK